MVNPYPTSDRRGDTGRSPPRRKPLTPGGLSRGVGRLPPGANENLPKAAARGLPKALRPLVPLGRAVPYLGTAILLWELYEWYRQQEAKPEIPPYTYDLSGWTLNRQCTGQIDMFRLSRNAGTDTCGFWSAYSPASNAVNDGKVSLVGSGATRRTIARFFRRQRNGSGTNIDRIFYQQWEKLTPSPLPAQNPTVPEASAVPARYSSVVPFYETPSLLRTVAPQALPVGQWVSPPAPIPYWMLPHIRPNLWEVPSQRRMATYRVPRPDINPDYPAQPVPKPYEVPLIVPPVVISNNPAAVAGPDLRALHALRPARKGEKERKVRLAAPILLNMVTETDDFITSLYYALPRDKRAKFPGTNVTIKKPSPQAKLAALAKHWESVDLPTALENLAMNEIEDRLIGKLARGVGVNSYLNGMVRSPLQGPAL